MGRPLSRQFGAPNSRFRTRHTRIVAAKRQPPVAFGPRKNEGIAEPKPVGDNLPRLAVLLHDSLEKLQRCSLVPSCRDHSLQDFAFVVDGAPEMAELAIDLHKHLIQMPAPLRIAAHMRDASLADLGGEHRAEPIPPEPDRLVADVYPALRQQILDDAQGERVSHLHHHDETDDLRRTVEISERVAHGINLPRPRHPRAFGLTLPSAVLPATMPESDTDFFGADFCTTVIFWSSFIFLSSLAENDGKRGGDGGGGAPIE